MMTGCAARCFAADGAGDALKEFVVADLSADGELRLQERYSYDRLEQVHGAAELIVHLATLLYREPETFDTPLPLVDGPAPRWVGQLALRWRSTAASAGIATVRVGQDLASLSLLACGKDPNADALTLAAFQHHLVKALHDTGIEPAFGLRELPERPLVATINFRSPPDPSERFALALADRCFAAAYFRYQGLA